MTNETNLLVELSNAMHTVAAQPHNAQLWANVGFVYLRLNELQEALATFQAAQQINPRVADAWYGEAIVQQKLGHTLAAQNGLQKAIHLAPNDQRLFAAYAYLCAAAQQGTDVVKAAYIDWAKRFAEPLKPKHRPPPHRRSPQDKLRIGYVSADFRQHALMHFFAPVLAQHNRDRFQIIAFSNGKPDQTTSAIKTQFDFWNDIRGLNDQALADLIKKRGIDILIDLSGHTEGNRLLAFARQPAAYQLTWYGYNGTTGMTAIDGRLTDAVMDPIGHEVASVEPLLRLPNFACFQPPIDAPGIFPTPCLKNGFVTFGSLNNAQKLSDNTLKTWAILLQNIPSARLTLVGPHAATAAESITAPLQQRLASCGLPLDRVTVLPHQNLHDFLRLGQKIDIALESFPLSGAVTTCQALWMGLPVVALNGQQAFERAAAAILNAAHCASWVATSTTQYIEIATQLASTPNTIDALRHSLRNTLEHSPLMDYATQTQALENLLLTHMVSAVSA